MKTELGNLNEQLNDWKQKDKAFFDDAFTQPTTGNAYNIPPQLRHVSERLCRSYGIKGCCDPMYIANVIAFELGLGDGQSNFKENTVILHMADKEDADRVKDCIRRAKASEGTVGGLWSGLLCSALKRCEAK